MSTVASPFASVTVNACTTNLEILNSHRLLRYTPLTGDSRGYFGDSDTQVVIIKSRPAHAAFGYQIYFHCHSRICTLTTNIESRCLRVASCNSTQAIKSLDMPETIAPERRIMQAHQHIRPFPSALL